MIARVAVDPDTGHVEILSYKVVQDVGLAINPRAVRSQIQGGVAQGIGYALHEQITIGGDGAMQQSGFEHYLVPLAADVLPIEIILHEGAPSIGPLGAKGAGEIPIMNVGATVACAVARATGRLVSELPLTPPRVLDLLTENRPGLDLSHISAVWQAKYRPLMFDGLPRACRKHFRNARLSPEHPRFHALLSFCIPKRRASKSFWSLTVQPSEKPKPFRNHSIASKPAMVRRAVLKDWKPPIFGMFFFTRKWSLSFEVIL